MTIHKSLLQTEKEPKPITVSAQVYAGNSFSNITEKAHFKNLSSTLLHVVACTFLHGNEKTRTFGALS